MIVVSKMGILSCGDHNKPEKCRKRSHLHPPQTQIFIRLIIKPTYIRAHKGYTKHIKLHRSDYVVSQIFPLG
jgi:hypothetical protein